MGVRQDGKTGLSPRVVEIFGQVSVVADLLVVFGVIRAVSARILTPS